MELEKTVTDARRRGKKTWTMIEDMTVLDLWVIMVTDAQRTRYLSFGSITSSCSGWSKDSGNWKLRVLSLIHI